jgi:drug/metabolite transporter (DMT)-like permease
MTTTTSSPTNPVQDETQLEVEATSLYSSSSTTADSITTAPETAQHQKHGTSSGIEIIKDAIFDELVSMANTENPKENLYLEMTITRSGSMIPYDLVSFATDGPIQFASKPSNERSSGKSITLQEPTHVPWYAYLLLGGTVVALASFGPVLALQVGVSGSMKTVWRQLFTSFVFFPFMAYEMHKHGGFPTLSKTQWFTFFMACLFYSGMGVGFVTALEYASVGICVILANSQCLILLVGKMFVGSHVSWMEVTGATVAFAGTIFVSIDSELQDSGGDGDDNSSNQNIMLGATLAFIFAGCGGVGYLMTAKVVRTEVPLFSFMFIIMMGGCVLIVPFQRFVLGEIVTFDRDVDYGIWGFLNWRLDRLPNDLIQVIFGNLVGTVGQIASMQFFDPLVITVACLMQPMIAELMATAVGVSPLPGWIGWIGNTAVVAGTLLVVAPPSIFSFWEKTDQKTQLDEKLVVEKEIV